MLAAIANWQPAWIAVVLPVWALALIGLGVLLLLLPAGIPLRSLGFVLLLPLAFPPRVEVPEGRAQVWVLDVGQGLAVLVRTREHALLYDAGPIQGEFDTGERVVVPSLRTLGASRLDLLLLSHADNDHSGGAEAVQRLLRVERVVSGEPSRHAPDLGAEPCESGSTWQWNDVRFSLWQWQAAQDSNQQSCVLQIEANGERILLTGDIDQPAEQAWLVSEQQMSSHWLLLPHHGSRSSSSGPFLQGVAAQAALISRSLHNPFGHPHPSVTARLEAFDIKAYDTALHGAIRIDLGGFSPPELQRSQRRFWREK